MLLDPAAFAALWPVVLFFCLVVLAIKLVSTGTAAAAFRKPLPIVMSSAFVLAQIGEFSFILEKIGRDAGLTPAGRGAEGSQIFIAVTVILIALTPLLFNIGKGLQHRLEDRPHTMSNDAPT